MNLHVRRLAVPLKSSLCLCVGRLVTVIHPGGKVFSFDKQTSATAGLALPIGVLVLYSALAMLISMNSYRNTLIHSICSRLVWK